MDANELRDEISLLILNKNGNTYTWDKISRIHAKTERLNGSNLFSQVGIGAKSVKFTIRKMDITLHNAFLWKEKHCFLTDIIEVNRMYYEVSAALIEPKICSIERTGQPTLNSLNRPVYGEKETIIFPGCLTEKYLKNAQEKPMSTIQTTYVLVISKAITLELGEIVTIENISYTVKIPHILDDYKNEYEIIALEEA